MNLMELKPFHRYSKKRFIFLMLGSIFHGGMVFAFKAIRTDFAIQGNIIRAITGGLGAGVFWGLVFHLITMLKYKRIDKKI